MALVRVKRRLQDEPIDTLLLACKKQKTEESPLSSTVFKFAATVDEKDKDTDFQSYFNNAKESIGSDVKDSIHKKRQVVDITDKLRAENKLFSRNNRLKVINLFRHVDSEGPEQELTVIDIENKPHQVMAEAPRDSHSLEESRPSTNEQYVYDLYYCNDGAFDEIQTEHMLSAHAVDELMIDLSVPEENEDEDHLIDDEDDSNDENNWRNDYPDEISDDSSIEDNDMRLALRMRNVNLDGEYESDLSSDREDDALIYNDDRDTHDYYCDSYSSGHSDSESN